MTQEHKYTDERVAWMRDRNQFDISRRKTPTKKKNQLRLNVIYVDWLLPIYLHKYWSCILAKAIIYTKHTGERNGIKRIREIVHQNTDMYASFRTIDSRTTLRKWMNEWKKKHTERTLTATIKTFIYKCIYKTVALFSSVCSVHHFCF